MNSSQRAIIRLAILFLMPGLGALGWYRLAVLQQLLLQCQASYLWRPALKKFQDGDYEGSLEDFYRLLWLDPSATETELYTYMLHFYLATNSEPVLPSLATMGLDQMDTVIYNNRGTIRCNRGDFRGAIADYTEAIQLQPDSAAVYYNRGSAHFAVGDRLQSREDLQTAAQLWQVQEMTDWHASVLKELDDFTDE